MRLSDAIKELEDRGATILRTPSHRNVASVILKELGPRRVGGRYWDGYWQREYTVQGIVVDDHNLAITVQYHNEPYSSTHGTPWDYRFDKELE